MALNFPSDPGSLQPANEWIDDNGVLWIYDNTTNTWTAQKGGGGGGGGTDSPFNFRGQHDFTDSTVPDPAAEGGDLFVHDGGTGTIDAAYTGISGQITDGQLVLFDGAEYNMLSGSVPGYPDTGDGNGADLDDRYVMLVGDDDNQQIIQGEAGLKTEGLLESEGGVKVSGGINLEDKASITFADDLNVLAIQSLNSNSKINIFDGGFNTNGTFKRVGPQNAGLGAYATYGAEAASAITFSDGADYSNVPGSILKLGFLANPKNLNLDSADTQIYAGFYGDVYDTSGKAFNFYAKGTAPNYFKGSTYIGGTTARNTFDLWKSTLTEEQLEQLEAGTLAAPANVATPGNGEYARQWYYNQQDAETQAALTAGTLEYPEHLAEATFTDTFDLGDNTKTNLLSDGTGQFSGKVQSKRGFGIWDSNWPGFDMKDETDRPLYGLYFQNYASVLSSGGYKTLVADYSGSVEVGKEQAEDKTEDGNYGHGFSTRLADGATTAFRIRSHTQHDSNSTNNYAVEFKIDSNATLDNAIGYSAVAGNTTIEAGSTVENFTGFLSSFSNDDYTGTGYGFYSDVYNTNSGTTTNFNFYAAGSAPNYFAGLVEGNSGVKVSGGTYVNVETGILATDFNSRDQLQLVAGGANCVFIMDSNERVGVQKLQPDSAFNVEPKTAPKYGVRYYTPPFEANQTDTYGFLLNLPTVEVGTTVESVTGYFTAIGSDSKSGTNTYGFRSFCQSSSISGQNNYSFYAGGNAPNFFAGETRIQGRLKLFVKDASGDLGSFSVVATEGSSPNGGFVLALDADASSKPYLQQFIANGTDANITGRGFEFRANNAQRGSIRFNNSGGIDISETSDYRTKSNIVQLESAVDIIKAINPVRYDRGLATGVPGFIAHELQEHVPNAVMGEKDATESIGTLTDYNGTVLETEVTEPSAEELTYTEMVPDEHQTTAIDGEQKMVEVTRTKTWKATGERDIYQSVDQTKLIPLLTKALQEALERIEALEAAAAG